MSRRLRQRAGDERGVMALMTLVFMVFLGIVLVVFLWTIGYAGGAYNSLQTSVQAAADAAATAVSADSSGAQPQFICQASYDAIDGACTGGTTFDVASRTLSYALAHTSAKFGLSYPGNVFLVRDNLASVGPPTIMAYQINVTPGLARRLDPGCLGHAVDTITPGPDQRTCWRAVQAGIGEPQYESGVAIYARTEVRLPGCVASWCPTFDLLAVGAASESQDPTQSY